MFRILGVVLALSILAVCCMCMWQNQGLSVGLSVAEDEAQTVMGAFCYVGGPEIQVCAGWHMQSFLGWRDVNPAYTSPLGASGSAETGKCGCGGVYSQLSGTCASSS